MYKRGNKNNSAIEHGACEFNEHIHELTRDDQFLKQAQDKLESISASSPKAKKMSLLNLLQSLLPPYIVRLINLRLVLTAAQEAGYDRSSTLFDAFSNYNKDAKLLSKAAQRGIYTKVLQLLNEPLFAFMVALDTELIASDKVRTKYWLQVYYCNRAMFALDDETMEPKQPPQSLLTSPQHKSVYLPEEDVDLSQVFDILYRTI